MTAEQATKKGEFGKIRIPPFFLGLISYISGVVWATTLNPEP